MHIVWWPGQLVRWGWTVVRMLQNHFCMRVAWIVERSVCHNTNTHTQPKHRTDWPLQRILLLIAVFKCDNRSAAAPPKLFDIFLSYLLLFSSHMPSNGGHLCSERWVAVWILTKLSWHAIDGRMLHWISISSHWRCWIAIEHKPERLNNWRHRQQLHISKQSPSHGTISICQPNPSSYIFFFDSKAPEIGNFHNRRK